MATLPGVGRSHKIVDEIPRERIAECRGKWVALAPSSQLLGFAETAAMAYAAGQAAGEPKPTIRRVPA
jgi:hypothetical protein